MVGNDSEYSGGDDMVGRVLAGRYRVVEVVTRGANTIICAALDIQTDQPVTFKIVQPELSDSEEFRREFRKRGEVATALTHPNIAAVLDWGDIDIDGESTVFWVVEFLGGGSLRDLFDRGRLLEPSQALVFGLEACRALDAAHQRGIAHTELTPSKLVFGADRRLRVVDFGVAELIGRAAWAEPATVATHVARYASPEQALGLTVGPKTDVYALALCLLEAVTGKVPFASDSTVSTLAARVDKLMPVSADLGSLASVIERSGRPEADDRFTAAELGRALVQAAETLPRPEPIPIVASTLFERVMPDPAVVAPTVTPEPAVEPEPTVTPEPAVEPEPTVTPEPAVEPEPTESSEPAVTSEPDVVAAAAVTATAAVISAAASDDLAPVADIDSADIDSADIDSADIDSAEIEPEGIVDNSDREGLVILLDQDPTPSPMPEPEPASEPTTVVSASPATEQMPVTAIVAPGAVSELYDDERPKRRSGVMALLAVCVLAGLAAVAFAAFYLLRTKSYEVPDLEGVEQAVAMNEIAGNDWVIAVERERSDIEPDAGQVIRTFPAAGAVLEEGSDFTIFVSEGPLFRLLPDVTGQTSDAAMAALVGLQLQSVVDSEEFDETATPGIVLAWRVLGAEASVAGDEVLPGTTVALTVSKGPAPRVVPDVTGLTIEDAQAAAAGVQLNVVAGEDAFSDDVPAGIVISQDVAAGDELPRDGTFTVIRSKGPDLVSLPDLTGLSYVDAQKALTDAGFTIGSLLGTTEGTFESISISAEPIGDQYRRGTPVDLIFL